MTSPGRQFNDAVTRFWSFAAPVYDLPFLQRLVYQPAQDEVVAELDEGDAGGGGDEGPLEGGADDAGIAGGGLDGDKGGARDKVGGVLRDNGAGGAAESAALAGLVSGPGVTSGGSGVLSCTLQRAAVLPPPGATPAPGAQVRAVPCTSAEE